MHERTDDLVASFIISEKPSQKCHASQSFIKSINARPRDTIEVVGKHETHLCRIWPKKDLATNQLIIETAETKQKMTVKSVCVLSCCVAKKINLSLVILNNRTLPDLPDRISTILKNSVVFKGTVVKNLPLTRYGVHCVVVNDVMPESECWCIGKSTEIIIDKVMSVEKYSRIKPSTPLGGLERQGNQLREFMCLNFQLGRRAHENGVCLPKSCLISGPSGCGKTSLVKQIAFESEACLMLTNGNNLLGSRPGESETNLRENFKKVLSLSEDEACVWFIDEIDTLTTGKGASETRISTQLAMLLDELRENNNSNLVFVAASNRPNEIDKNVLRRIDREIVVGVPRVADRRNALQALTQDLNLQSSVNLNSVAEATPGYLGADLKALVNHAVHTALIRNHYQAPVTVLPSDFDSALHAVVPSTQRNSDIIVDLKPVSWDDIGGLAEVKQKIKQAVEWPLIMPEAFQRLGISPPKGVLLYGPPGCAKTSLVRAAASSCHVTFLSVNGAQLYSPFVGDSEKKISEVFQQARAGAPCILFLDEIDSLVGNRSKSSSSGSSVQERVLSTLLNQMDGVGLRANESPQVKLREGETSSTHAAQETQPVDNSQVLIVAATNRPDMLDDALLRPGRFDRIIYVPPPDLEGRQEILKIYKNTTPTSPDVSVEKLAQRTEGFTGADLENLCREAALCALTSDGLDATEVKIEHIDRVMKTLTPSISPEQLKQYACIKFNK